MSVASLDLRDECAPFAAAVAEIDDSDNSTSRAAELVAGLRETADDSE